MATDVRKSTQRDRLLDGMLQAAVRHGYAGATVTETITNAGVSRPTFYEYFNDRDGCFLAVHDDLAGRLLARVREEVDDSEPERAVQTAACAMLKLAEDEPDAMRFLCDETLAAGPSALDARDATLEQVEQIVAHALEQAPSDALAADIPLRAVLGGMQRVLAPRLRRGEQDFTALIADLATLLASYERPLHRHRWRKLEPGPRLLPSTHASEIALRPPPPIPPGRSMQSSQEIARNQRERILFATAEVAADKGYNAMTVADITYAGKVDRRVFYTHFRDKQQAFLAIHELAVQQMMAVSASAFFNANAWPERIWQGIRASTQFDDTYPAIAHAGYVEAHAVGTGGIQRIEDSRIAFTIFMHEGNQSAQTPISNVAMESITAAIFEIGYQYARAHKVLTWEIGRLTPHAAYIVLAPFIGLAATDELITSKLTFARDPKRRRHSEILQ